LPAAGPTLGPSRSLHRIIWLVHGVSALALQLSTLPLTLELGLLALLAWLLSRNLRRLGRSAGWHFVLGEQLRIADASGEWPVESALHIGPALWLAWRDGSGASRHLMLLPDCCEDSAAWRRLNVWSRHRLVASGD